MLAKQKQAIEAYQRVQDFLANHPPPDMPGYAIQKKNLDAVIARLTDHSATQVMGYRLRRGETPRHRLLRRVLREEHLAPIAQVARTTLGEAPGIEKALRMPAYNLSSLKLVAESIAIRNAVAPYERQFIEGGLATDFLAKLDVATENVRQSVLGKERYLGRQVGAGVGLEKEIKRGRRAIDLLDVIVRATFRDDQDVLAEWRVARRVRAVPGGSAPSSSAGESSAAVQTTPVLSIQTSSP